jgi:hypothetical protein
MESVYDYIIIGSGISGLYAAYKILQISPQSSILILERNKKAWLGGRTSNEIFYGTTIVTGAGIGRQKKDKLLKNLLQDLDIKYHKYSVNKVYAPSLTSKEANVDVNKTIAYLKREYNKNPAFYKGKTFRDFSIDILGEAAYNNFTISTGYTDYENADIYDTLYNYGMDDNSNKIEAFTVPWKEMIDKLIDKLLHYNVDIKSLSKVIKMNKLDECKSSCGFIVSCENGKKYKCTKIIIATTISSIHKLLPTNEYPIYKQIHGQPFLRLYGKFSGKSALIMKNTVKSYTIVPGPLYKIIPINVSKGVYMIAYSDNSGAVFLKNHLKNTHANRNLFARLLEKSLGLPFESLDLVSIIDFYWDIGTHYYEPLSTSAEYKNRSEFIQKAQHPMNGIVVVGEVVALDQGWTEGALHSVELAVTKKWLHEKC